MKKVYEARTSKLASAGEIYSKPHFCCKAGAAPEIIGYYAANLNSALLGNNNVRSAKPNALLFAFINYPVRPE